MVVLDNKVLSRMREGSDVGEIAKGLFGEHTDLIEAKRIVNILQEEIPRVKGALLSKLY